MVSPAPYTLQHARIIVNLHISVIVKSTLFQHVLVALPWIYVRILRTRKYTPSQTRPFLKLAVFLDRRESASLGGSTVV